MKREKRKEKKNRNVFIKVFAYTMLLVLLVSLTAVALFARQFISYYEDEQQRQLNTSFQPVISIIGDRNRSQEEIIEAVRIFADQNQSYNFMIQEGDGAVVFSTFTIEGADGVVELPLDDTSLSLSVRFMGGRSGILGNYQALDFGQVQVLENYQVWTTEHVQAFGLADEYIFTGYLVGTNKIDYGDLIRRSLLALGFMLVIAVFGAVLFARKVTKPLEDEIIRERTMEENQRLFFSAASHELKTPIAAARALVEGMIAGVGDYRDHPKYLRECMKTLDSQTKLVSEILEIVKLRDDAPPSLGAVDLHELGNTVLAEYRPLAEMRGLVIEGEFPHTAVKAEWNLLQRVLSNIMANTVQNTREGNIIRIITEENQKSLHLSILNTGAHIPEEVMQKLFQPFFRLDFARTSHDQSGLGLAIVKKALDRMQVPFSLENTGEGVLFRMELPILHEPGKK